MPWTRLHVDFAGQIYNLTYLIIVAANSKWPKVIPQKQAVTNTIMAAADKVLSIYEIPETLVADNDTQFTSSQLTGLCDKTSINTPRNYHSVNISNKNEGQWSSKRKLERKTGI